MLVGTAVAAEQTLPGTTRLSEEEQVRQRRYGCCLPGWTPVVYARLHKSDVAAESFVVRLRRMGAVIGVKKLGRSCLLRFDLRSQAWVVECSMCHCVIVAFARDPQLEHGTGEVVVTPQNSCVLECMCCGSAYRYSGADFVQGAPRPNPACLRKHPNCKMDGALLVACP